MKRAIFAGASGQAGTIDGASLSVKHGNSLTLFSSFDGHWEAQNIAQLKLLGKAMSFTVDLSRVGCACNLALYLASSPARGADNLPSRGLDRGGQPPFYCDANK